MLSFTLSWVGLISRLDGILSFLPLYLPEIILIGNHLYIILWKRLQDIMVALHYGTLSPAEENAALFFLL